MTDDRSLERAARSWLEVGPRTAPDRAVEAALLRIETTPQERDLRIPWRFSTMSTPARVGVAAVLGVVILGGAFYVLGRPSQSSVGVPVPSARPSPTAPPPTARPSAPAASASQAITVDYSTLPGRILAEHLGNAIDGSEMPTTDSHPERRRFYFLDPATMTGATAVEFLPNQPAGGKTAADVSSDGTKVVFQDFTDKPRLYEANLDGTNFHQIPITCDCQLLYPDYDPTATKVVYVRVEGGKSWLEIRDLTSGKTTKLESTVGPANDAVPEQPAWSPDGKTIAFNRVTWGNGGADSLVVGTIHYCDTPPLSGVLSLLDVATAKVHDLPIPPDWFPGDANWSPDSTTIVFSFPVSTTGSNSGMTDSVTHRIQADGTGLVLLPGWGAPEYLPDGQHILIQDNVFNVMRADGSDYLPVNNHASDLTDLPHGYIDIGHWIPAAP